MIFFLRSKILSAIKNNGNISINEESMTQLSGIYLAILLVTVNSFVFLSTDIDYTRDVWSLKS